MPLLSTCQRAAWCSTTTPATPRPSPRSPSSYLTSDSPSPAVFAVLPKQKSVKGQAYTVAEISFEASQQRRVSSRTVQRHCQYLQGVPSIHVRECKEDST
ncbi:E3 ubiquitin-protein ligase MSL2 isoform X4 [Mauremys reevesii]|uniref:E3 ubiquitin-protein ligase MSL2 isoform X4 n=1 Tax=Mauremys reevesii TaxID=260615 RepID=UPI00193FEFB7|nr:E3 ubiquitin-protein ligase MSL2 isoform X4 [Mauremys reevesii]